MNITQALIEAAEILIPALLILGAMGSVLIGKATVKI
jgi:hypothetical protein